MKKTARKYISFALILAVLAISGCASTTESTSIPTANDEVNPKQLLLSALDSFYTPEQNFLSGAYRMTGDIAYSEDALSESTCYRVSPVLDIDIDSEGFTGTLDISAGDEALKTEAVLTENVYYLKIDGINDTYVMLDGIPEAAAPEADIKDALGRIASIFDISLRENTENADETLFSVRDDSCVVKNEGFENVTVVTVTLGKDELSSADESKAEITAYYKDGKAVALKTACEFELDGSQIKYVVETTENGKGILFEKLTEYERDNDSKEDGPKKSHRRFSYTESAPGRGTGFFATYDLAVKNGEETQTSNTIPFTVTTDSNGKCTVVTDDISYNGVSGLPYSYTVEFKKTESGYEVGYYSKTLIELSSVSYSSAIEAELRFEKIEKANIQKPAETISDGEKIQAITEQFGNAYPEIARAIGYQVDSSENKSIIHIVDGASEYTIYPESRNGIYVTEFVIDEDYIVLEDGRRIPFIYTDMAPLDEESNRYSAVINKRNYILYEYTDFDGTTVQVLECTDTIEGFMHISTVTYTPELGTGKLTMGFVFENTNDEYTLTFPDGFTEARTILYNEENGEYYFAE